VKAKAGPWKTPAPATSGITGATTAEKGTRLDQRRLDSEKPLNSEKRAMPSRRGTAESKKKTEVGRDQGSNQALASQCQKDDTREKKLRSCLGEKENQVRH